MGVEGQPMKKPDFLVVTVATISMVLLVAGFLVGVLGVFA